MLDRSAIGRASSPGLNEVERGAVRRFAEAIGDPRPIHVDPDAARHAGYRDVVAPPTFPATFHPGSDPCDGLFPDEASVLHGEQVFEYEREIVAGDRITVVRRIADVRSDEARVDVVVLEDDGADSEGRSVYRARKVLVVRRG